MGWFRADSSVVVVGAVQWSVAPSGAVGVASGVDQTTGADLRLCFTLR